MVSLELTQANPLYALQVANTQPIVAGWGLAAYRAYNVWAWAGRKHTNKQSIKASNVVEIQMGHGLPDTPWNERLAMESAATKLQDSVVFGRLPIKLC
jgi:hypothetical protein